MWVMDCNDVGSKLNVGAGTINILPISANKVGGVGVYRPPPPLVPSDWNNSDNIFGISTFKQRINLGYMHHSNIHFISSLCVYQTKQKRPNKNMTTTFIHSYHRILSIFLYVNMIITCNKAFKTWFKDFT